MRKDVPITSAVLTEESYSPGSHSLIEILPGYTLVIFGLLLQCSRGSFCLNDSDEKEIMSSTNISNSFCYIKLDPNKSLKISCDEETIVTGCINYSIFSNL